MSDPTSPPNQPPQPPVPPSGYGYPQQPYPQQPYGYPQYGYPAQRGTNGFAIASLICAFLCWPLGLIFGFVARNQIKEKGESGDGLALAGIIISFVFLGLTALYIIGIVTFLSTHPLNTFYVPPQPT